VAADEGLAQYVYNGDSDEEIDALAVRRTDGDSGVTFSKKGIVEYIEAQFSAADKDSKNWVSVGKKPSFKIFKHKVGSHVTKDHLYMRSEGTFASKYKISRILKALFDPVHRGEWEKKNLESYTVHETDHPNVKLPYWRYKAQL